MYIVYVNNISRAGTLGSNDIDLALITDNLEEAQKTAQDILNNMLKNEKTFPDHDIDASFTPDGEGAIVFWNTPNNWDWYSEINIAERTAGELYYPPLQKNDKN